MDKKKVAYIILFSFLVYTFIIGFYGDNIANWATMQNSLVQLIAYYLTQSSFIVILLGSLYIGHLRKKITQTFIGGLLLDIVTDIIDTPHCVLSSGFIANAPNLTLCSDTIIIRWLDGFLPHLISYNLYYWVFPIIFALLAFELLGVTEFLKYFEE